jgi:hypothetical protein
MKNRIAYVFALCALFAPEAWAQAQITTGVIQGQVSDTTDAVLPGVTVVARNVETNFNRTLVTNGQGRYTFLQMPLGTYVLTFELGGFATFVNENVELSVGQALSLNPTLQVATASETITVSGTPLIEVSRTEVSNTLNATTIRTTPVLGRKFEDLLTLTPGASVVQGPDGDEITFYGQRGVFNNISLDGGDYNNGFFGEQVGGQRAAIDITLDAIQEFQVVGTGANAEFGRTAGGIVNVITKSGTNELHGSLFHFQRLEGLTSTASDGSKLEDFHREQTGGTIGGPIVEDEAFFFLAAERIGGNFKRANLSAPIGSPCPVSNPTIQNDEALIDSNADCQRVALLGFLQDNVGIDDGRPVEHPVATTSLFAKLDFVLNDANNLGISYNFLHSRNENATFDVDTFGNSANGVEGDPARIHVVNLNLFSTLSSTKLNELHVTYSRENRPRTAAHSGLTADTGIGFEPSFRFGDPYFLQPGVDEVFWRTQVKNNLSIVAGDHTVKIGGEWIHSKNTQVFRGFFTGRYIFGSATGFLRYASPAAPGGFGPNTANCADGSYITYPEACPGGGGPAGGPLLLYLQGADRAGLATDDTGFSAISNDEFGLWVQDSWQVNRNLTLNYGLRWDAQVMPDLVDPTTTAYAQFLDDPRFPSDGNIPDQWTMFQPRAGFAWDIGGRAKSVLRGNAGIYNPRQNMLTQVGSVTTNGIQQQTLFRDASFVTFAPMPVWPGVLTPDTLPGGEFPLFSGVRAFHRDYKNPKITTWNVTYEQEVAPDWSLYVDFTRAKGVNLTRFLDYGRSEFGAPFAPQLGEVMITSSVGTSTYRGGTFGVRKRFSNGFQLEGTYVLAKDEDDDSNERDPFTDRSFDPTRPELDFARSDRDIRHKFNLFTYAELGPVQLNVRLQARSAQPISTGARANPRNTLEKDNKYFSLDCRLQWPIHLGSKDRFELIPIVEAFNLTNSTNNVNPLSSDLLFNFDGFLRKGIGDPRQIQFAMRFVF